MLKRVTFKSEITTPVGLKPFVFRDLAKVVILAGANGSGKTRYLNLLDLLATHDASLPNVRREISRVENWIQLNRMSSALGSRTPPLEIFTKGPLDGVVSTPEQSSKDNYERQLEEQKKLLQEWNYESTNPVELPTVSIELRHSPPLLISCWAS